MTTFIVYYYGLGLPLAYILALKSGFGLLGVWISLILCTILINFTLAVMIYLTDFDKVITEISKKWKENNSRK